MADIERLLPALTAMSNSMELQSASLSNVLEGELIRADADFDDAIEPTQDMFATMGGSLVVVEAEMMTQTQLLSGILSVNEELLDIRKREIAEQNREDRFRDVTDSDSGDDDREGDEKSAFMKMIEALGKERVPLKKGLLMAAAIPLITGAIEGLVESFFGEESAKKVEEMFDNVFDFETIAATSLGTLLFGVKGGLMGLIFTKVRQATEDALDKLDVFPEEVNDALAIAVGAIAAAMVTKTGRRVVRSIFNAGARTLGPAGAGAGPGAAQAAARGAAAGAGAGAGAAAAADTPERAPTPRPAAEVRERMANLTDEELDKQGVKRSTNAKGVVQYQYKTGGFVNQGEFLDKMDQEAALEKAKARFPKFGMVAKVLGPIGYGLAVYDMAVILNDDTLTQEQKNKELSGLLGSVIGGVGGAAAGAALGSIVAPGPGTFIGGLIGGVGGAFAGDYLGEQTANMILGDPVDEAGIEAIAQENGYEEEGTQTATPAGQRRREQRKESIAKSTAPAASVAPESADMTSGSTTPATASVSPSEASEAQLSTPNAIQQSEESQLAAIERAIMIQFGDPQGGAGDVNVPLFNNGGNTINNMGGNSSSTTINVFEDAKQFLSNAVPVPMTART